MQNLLKRRLAPLFGIIAIVAVMGFVMIGCGEVDPEEALDEFPFPTVEAWEYGAFVGKPLTANYKGKVQVNYSWFNVEAASPTTAIAGATSDTYTPTEPGKYYVRVTDKATLGSKGFKNSTPNIEVRAAPAHIDYLGKWLMKGVDNKWEPETGKGDGYNETITLWADKDFAYKFRLDSTYQNEYLSFNISNWTAIGSAALTNVTTSGTPTTVGQDPNTITAIPVTYAEGWTLNLTGGATDGYSSAANYTAMNLYKLSTTGDAQMRRNAGGTTSNVINRIYIKQAD